MELFVSVLCALTAFACAVLLMRAYRRTGTRLLLWSSLCFVGLSINSVLLIVDVGMDPERDLSIIRTLPAIAGVALLLYGLIWESSA